MIAGHAYEAPEGMPPEYAGPCTECGYGRDAPHHWNQYGPVVPGRLERDQEFHRTVRAIVTARGLARLYKETTNDPYSRAGFNAIVIALEEAA